MRTPNFIIGGAAAGGTSYLYELLIQHPEIYLPQQRIPEPHYYYKSWEYAKGLNWYLNQYFRNVPNEKVAIGERSSSYLYGGRKISQRIAKDFPDMKFIFMLRNPIERAWGNYRFTALQGLEELTFKEALLQEERRIGESQGIWSEIQPYDYTGRGFYAKQLKEFLEFFPKRQILCIKSESLNNNDLSLLPKIYEFLGLENTDFVSCIAPNHTSFSVIDVRLQKQLRQHFGDRIFSELMQSIRKEEAIVDSEESEWILKLKNNIKTAKDRIPEECFEILKESFGSDIEELESMVDFSVDDWRYPSK